MEFYFDWQWIAHPVNEEHYDFSSVAVRYAQDWVERHMVEGAGNKWRESSLTQSLYYLVEIHCIRYLSVCEASPCKLLVRIK